MSELDFNNIPPPVWTEESKAAYLACAIDTDGWISLRFQTRNDGVTRISAHVGVTNTSIPLLERFAEFGKVPPRIKRNGIKGRDSRGIVTRGDVWETHWSSPPHVVAVLEKAIPYLIAKQQRALWTLEFCRSRITEKGLVARSGRPYTSRCWELAKLVSLANGRRSKFPVFQEGLCLGVGRTTHNAARTLEYRIWQAAKHRASMCDTWRKSFETFIHDVGLRPTSKHQLTRLDKTKPFAPNNVHWHIR